MWSSSGLHLADVRVGTREKGARPNGTLCSNVKQNVNAAVAVELSTRACALRPQRWPIGLTRRTRQRGVAHTNADSASASGATEWTIY